MDVVIRRSPNRRKTASARLTGDVLEVLVPTGLPEAQEQALVDGLRRRLERRREGRRLNADGALVERAQALNQRYFKGKLSFSSVEFTTAQEASHGSCTPTRGAIRISSKLAGAPAWVQDYVLVHELAHMVEPNHGPAFHALVARYPLAERAKGYLLALEDMGALRNGGESQ